MDSNYAEQIEELEKQLDFEKQKNLCTKEYLMLLESTLKDYDHIKKLFKQKQIKFIDLKNQNENKQIEINELTQKINNQSTVIESLQKINEKQEVEIKRLSQNLKNEININEKTKEYLFIVESDSANQSIQINKLKEEIENIKENKNAEIIKLKEKIQIIEENKNAKMNLLQINNEKQEVEIKRLSQKLKNEININEKTKEYLFIVESDSENQNIELHKLKTEIQNLKDYKMRKTKTEI